MQKQVLTCDRIFSCLIDPCNVEPFHLLYVETWRIAGRQFGEGFVSIVTEDQVFIGCAFDTVFNHDA